jgi:SAM-dependent methyltransferase
MSSLGQFSEYYDLLYSDKDYRRESLFILDILDQKQKGGVSLLELGCGTGRHAVMMAEAGWNVHGIDLDSEMLMAAKERKRGLPEKISERLQFTQGDVRKFDMKRQYDAAVSLFHVVSYQTATEDILAMFSHINAHLKPGGVFIFDYWYGPAVLTNRPEVRIKRMSSSDLHVTRLAEPKTFPNKSIVDVNYEIQIQKKGSSQVEVLHEKHRMRYFFLSEIDSLLRESGLRLVSSAEWLTNNEPGLDTWGVYSVAIK